MSDFIFSSTSRDQGVLKSNLLAIHRGPGSDVKEYHGSWGALAMTRGPYNGFQPIDNERHLFVILGGPALCFCDNGFLTGPDPVAGTRALYQRWVEGRVAWDDDLSGPFAVIVVDKIKNHVTCVTDLMSFIPLYILDRGNRVAVASHVDVLANATDQSHRLDDVSMADFILNDVVTWPHTIYSDIKLMSPASATVFDSGARQTQHVYWQPSDHNPFGNVAEAAECLRAGVQGYVRKVTASMNEVAHFISAGEDSRAVSGMLPRHLKRHAYIYLSRMNREGRTAARLAEANGCDFHCAFRDKYHRLTMLEPASDLIGSGHQYTHAHSLEFWETWHLDRYPAVFGGYLSDSLLKAAYCRKLGPSRWLPFIPRVAIGGETRTKPVTHPSMPMSILDAVTDRRREHFARVAMYRHNTAHEWFSLWPSTMRGTMSNFYTTRRLFRSYEPFMSAESVKVSAAAPVSWKLNRRLFNRAMRPFLESTKWILHPDGTFPYFPWWFNMPVQSFVRSGRFVAGYVKSAGQDGPRSNLPNMENDPTWHKAVAEYASGFDKLAGVFSADDPERLLMGDDLTKVQKLNLLQVLCRLSRIG